MIYVFFAILAIGMFLKILCCIMIIVSVVGIIFYIKPPKSWGNLLLYSGYTTKEKVGMGIFTAAVIFLIAANLIDGNFMRESSDIWGKTGMWMKAVTLILTMINCSLPARIFENGLRDYLKFESWEDIKSIKILEDNRVEVGLKTPGVRKKAYFRLKAGDELPEACREKMVNSECRGWR